MELEWTMSPQVVIRISLGTFIKGIMTTILMIVGLFAVCYMTYNRWSEKETSATHPEPSPEQAEGKTKHKREQKVKISNIKWNVGVQGPVHYSSVGQTDGVYGRYVHATQGFSRGWEVTKEMLESRAGLKGQ
eukprot:5706360-Pyramimonas_sp.AAC.1